MSTKVKPRWLILGGTGFIGRNLVKYLLDNNLSSCIGVADKKAPFMAFLHDDYKTCFENPSVIFTQIDVSDDDMIANAFNSGDGIPWDYVVYLAGESTLGKSAEFYQKTVIGAQKAANISVQMGVKKFVFVSTASVYKGDSSIHTESGKLDPWTDVASSLLEAEKVLQSIPDLPLLILRPSQVYGPGDWNSLMVRCVIAATYRYTKEKMENLWDGDVRSATVHVFDVVRAIVHLARKVEPGHIFNLSDKGNTTVGIISSLLGEIFSIETGFLGSFKSNIAKVNLRGVADVANNNHLGPWLRMLQEYSIKNTPLSPFLHVSLLAHNHLGVDGSAIESTGFQYAVPVITKDLLLDPIMQAISGKIFPPIL